MVGSFTADGLTFAVRPTLVAQFLVEGSAPSAADVAGSDAARQAPAEAARVAGSGLQVELVGVAPGALVARGADDLAAKAAGEASSAALALPESIAYQGVEYSVASIGSDAFAGCDVQEVVFPASLMEVDSEAFRGSAVEAIVVADGNAVFASYDGALYSADMTRILLVPEGRSGQLRISSLAEEAAPQAFSHCALVGAFSVDAGCPGFSSENGFLYDAAGEVLVAAPGEAAWATAQSSDDGEDALAALDGPQAEGPAATRDGATVIDAVVAEGADAAPAATLGWATTVAADSWTLTVDCGEGPIYHYWDDWSEFTKHTGTFVIEDVVSLKKSKEDWVTVVTADGLSHDICPRGSDQPSGWWFSDLVVSSDRATITAVWTPYVKVSTSEGTLSVRDGAWHLLAEGRADITVSGVSQVVIDAAQEGFKYLNFYSTIDGYRNVFGHRGGYLCAGWKEVQTRQFEPVWQKHTYEIRYVLNGGSLSGQKMSYDVETADFSLKVPMRAGYQFQSWKVSGALGSGVVVSGSAAPFSTTVKKGTYGTLTAEAQWVPISYSISYGLDGGSLSGQPTSYTIESSDFSLPAPTRPGFTFLGWTVTGAAGTGVAASGTTATIKQGTYGNLTATARWGAPYTATFKGGGGTLDFYDAHANKTEKVSEKAIAWDGNTLIYFPDGGKVVHFWVGDKLCSLNAERAGYALSGWSGVRPDGTTFAVDASTGNQSIVPGGIYTALWEPVFRASTEQGVLDVRNGEWGIVAMGLKEVLIEGVDKVTVNQAPEGYKWLSMHSAEDGYRNIHGNRSGYLCKDWTEVSLRHYVPSWEPIFYAISYDLAGGSLSGQPQRYSIESLDFNLPAPSRTGHAFAGWTVTGAAGAGVVTSGTITTVKQGTYGNLTVTARWTPVAYSVSYNLDGGALSGQPTSYTIESPDLTLPVPTRVGHSFLGWTVTGASGTGVAISGATVIIKQGTYGNLTATARWGAPYSATIDAGGGAMRLYGDYGTNAEWLLEEGIVSRVIQWDSYQAIYGGEGDRCVHWPLDGQRRALYVDRTGYTFTGWSVVGPDGSTAVIDGSMGGQALIPGATYTALWDPYIKASTEHGSLTLCDGGWNELESGKGELTLRSLKEVKVETAVQPSFLNVRVADGPRNILAFRDGYTCVNWTEKEANHYVPEWAALTYAISYELDGGELPDGPTSYTIEDADFALPMPTRYGYSFAGWTVSGAQGTGPEEAGLTTTVKRGTYGNLTATARWTLRYDLDVPVAEPGNVTFEADSLTGDVRVAPGSSASGAILSYMAVPVALDALTCEGLDRAGALATPGEELELEAILGQGSASKVRFTAAFGDASSASEVAVQVGGSASLSPLGIPAAASRQAPGRLPVAYGLELEPGLAIPPMHDASPVARLVYTVSLGG